MTERVTTNDDTTMDVSRRRLGVNRGIPSRKASRNCAAGCTFPDHLRDVVPHECNPTYSPMPPLNAWKSRAQLQAERKARQMMEMEAEVEL